MTELTLLSLGALATFVALRRYRADRDRAIADRHIKLLNRLGWR
jgi:hypothetical protein